MEGTPTTRPVAAALPTHGPTDLAAAPPRTGTDLPAATFASFYRQDYERFVRLAYLLIGSTEQAEEIVQDAFVRLHGRWARVDNPGAYLRTAVVNGCRDSLRRRVRWRAREPVLATASISTDEPDEMFDALATLNPQQRAVIVLRFYGGLQEAEIADALGIKVGTVKSTIHRSIELLRKEIER